MTAYTAEQLDRARALRETLVSLIGDPSNIANADTTIATALAAECERAIEEAAQYLEATTETKQYAAELRRALSQPGGGDGDH